jgi:TonB family protein
MRRTGTFSLVVSIGVHGVLLAVVMLCAARVVFSPPNVHLVYGEVGSESSRGEIWKAGEENPPQNQVREEVPSGALTDALDAELMGGTPSKLGDAASQLATPLLLTADGAGGGGFGVENPAPVPRFHYSAPSFASNDAASGAGRAGVASGTDVTSIPQPIYPKESRRKGEQGTVLLEVVIKSDGSIGDIKVIEHPGHERLVNAAIEALRKARIEPALEDGKPIASTVRVPFNFVLR